MNEKVVSLHVQEMKSVDVKKMIENGESTEYVGKAVSHLAAGTCMPIYSTF